MELVFFFFLEFFYIDFIGYILMNFKEFKGIIRKIKEFREFKKN